MRERTRTQKLETGIFAKLLYITYIIGATLLIPLIVVKCKFVLSLHSLWIITGIVSIGWLVGKVGLQISPLIPPLLPALLIGLLTRIFLLNKIKTTGVSWIHDKHFNEAFASTSEALRILAMGVLVMRAGLGLDINALKRVAKTCLMLTVSPCTAETLICIFFAGLILRWNGLSFVQSMMWGGMMGAVAGDVTPAVIVPAIEDLKERGLVQSKVQRNIANLIIAAGSFDDVLMIAIYTFLKGIVFAEVVGNVSTAARVWGILSSPIFVLLGILVGWILATLLVKPMLSSSTFCVLVGLTLPFLLNHGSRAAMAEAAGPMACITFGLFSVHTCPDIFPATAKILDAVWLVLEPAVFVLIGCELDFGKLSTLKFVQLMGLFILSHGMRTLVAFLVVKIGGGYNNKHSLYVAISWMPKATVQAVIGSAALQSVMKLKNQNTPQWRAKKSAAEDILSLAVLSILITAPLGAFLMKVCGEPLLGEKDKDDKEAEAVAPSKEILIKDEERLDEHLINVRGDA